MFDSYTLTEMFGDTELWPEPQRGWHCLCGREITITRSYPDAKVTGWRCPSKDTKITITCRSYISPVLSDEAQKIAKLLGELL